MKPSAEYLKRMAARERSFEKERDKAIAIEKIETAKFCKRIVEEMKKNEKDNPPPTIIITFVDGKPFIVKKCNR